MHTAEPEGATAAADWIRKDQKQNRHRNCLVVISAPDEASWHGRMVHPETRVGDVAAFTTVDPTSQKRDVGHPQQELGPLRYRDV